jgi:hypothetical protein
MKHITIFIILMLMTSCAGQTRESTPLSDGRISKEEIFIYATISVFDLTEIITAVKKVESDSILMISAEDQPDGQIEVTTGVVRGPLDGGGKKYYLKRIDGTWVIQSQAFWVS